MLTAMRLGNFKAFADTQRVPLKPLTLIFGPNSAGKSSLIHGLLLARHAVDTGEIDVHRTVIGGDSVDLGGFQQYVYRGDQSRQVEWGAEIDTAKLTGRLAELLAPVRRLDVLLTIGVALDDLGQMAPGATPRVTSYQVEADGTPLLRLSSRRDGSLRLDRLAHDHVAFRDVIAAMLLLGTTLESLTVKDYAVLDEALKLIVPEIVFTPGNLLPTGVAGAGDLPDQLIPISSGQRAEGLATALRLFLPRTLDELVGGLSEAVARELQRVRYLGPLRSFPPRHLAFSQHHDPNWLAGGGHAWDIVRRDESVREAVNKWLRDPQKLSTPYSLNVTELVSEDYVDFEIRETLDVVNDELDEMLDDEKPSTEWLHEHFASLQRTIAKYARKVSELELADLRTHATVTHRDVGIGISQVLPVLVNAYAYSNQTVVIEQPEIHLHPGLQAELGDVFSESALGERRNTCILETHSEHLILRLMRRMRDTANDSLPDGLPPVRPEDVAILYVQPKESAAVVRVLELDEEGQLLDPWPGGFFEEGFRERFA
ncbi:MAG: DUF3696 domain-containing protein [Chloroflexi bacterium]|nr:DUF3696 domain-containing protein [Chloroflexota bacterium]